MGKKKTNKAERVSTYKGDVDDQNHLDLSMKALDTVSVIDIALLPRVSWIDLSLNKLEQLPANFPTLQHITVLDLSQNLLSSLPDSFGDLCDLRRLDLLGNQLTFSKLDKLQWLDLNNNPWDSSMPLEVAVCATSDTSDRDRKIVARRVLEHMKKRANDHEKKVAAKQRAKERKRAEELEQQRKEKEEYDKQKKLEKQRLKQQRKLEAEQVQRSSSTREESHTSRQLNSSSSLSDSAKEATSSRGIGSFILVLLLLIASGLFAVHHLQLVDLGQVTSLILDFLDGVDGSMLPF